MNSPQRKKHRNGRSTEAICLFFVGQSNLLLLITSHSYEIITIRFLNYRSMARIVFGYGTQKVSFVYVKCHHKKYAIVQHFFSIQFINYFKHCLKKWFCKTYTISFPR